MKIKELKSTLHQDKSESDNSSAKEKEKESEQQQELIVPCSDEDDVAETTLQLVFFDGEEAFKDWTATDSVYGARWDPSNSSCRILN